MIAIICAMKIEAQAIIDEMEDIKTERISGIEFNSGVFCKQQVVVAVCGVGKVFAALCTQTMIMRYAPHIIFNIGVAGSLSNKLNCADIVIATSVVQHDMDTTAVGDTLGLVSGINKINFECDAGTVRQLKQIAQRSLQVACVEGVIASGDRFIASKKDKEFINIWFGAVACDMESGAVGQVCCVNKTPFCIIRSISDLADNTSTYDYNEFLTVACENSVTIIKNFLKRS